MDFVDKQSRWWSVSLTMTVFHINTHALAGTTKHETLAKLKKWS